MKRKLLGKTCDEPVSAEMQKKIVAMVDQHLAGSAFHEDLRRTVGEAFQSQAPDSEADMDGGAWGAYVKKNKKPRKGGDLKEELNYGDGLKKKKGRPSSKVKRAFDPNSKTARRGAKVKEIMAKENLGFIDASRFVKSHNIPY